MKRELTQEMEQIMGEATELVYRYGLLDVQVREIGIKRLLYQSTIIRVADPRARLEGVKTSLLGIKPVIELNFSDIEILRESLGLSSQYIESVLRDKYNSIILTTCYTVLVMDKVKRVRNGSGVSKLKVAQAIQWVVGEMQLMKQRQDYEGGHESKPITSTGRTLEAIKEKEASLTPIALIKRDYTRAVNAITTKEKEIKAVKEAMEVNQRARGTREAELHDTKGWKFKKHKELTTERDGINAILATQEQGLVSHMIELSELQSSLQTINAKIVVTKLESTEKELEVLDGMFTGVFEKFTKMRQKVISLARSKHL